MPKQIFLFTLAAFSLALAGGCAGTPAAPVTAVAAPQAGAAPAAPQQTTTQQTANNADDEDENCSDDYATGSHVDHHHVCTSAADRAAVEEGYRTLQTRGGIPSH